MPTARRYNMVLESPLGRLGIILQDERIVRLDYLSARSVLRAPSSPYASEVAAQLGAFFNEPAHRFTLALDLRGTDFQCRVWHALTRIPAGETLTYGELAARLDSGARAVGNACRHNPVSVIVPCHRIVSATGIGGYSGKTGGREIDRKKWLLRHEGNVSMALKSRPTAPTNRITTNKQRTLHA